MDFVSSFLPESINWSCDLIVLLLSICFICKIDWLKIYKSGTFNVLATTVFFLGIVWMMRASLHNGLHIHLSGAMLMALMFGWRLGILGMSIVCVLVSLWGNSLPSNLGVTLILNVYIPVTLSYLIFLIIEACLPRHVFVYLFLTAFFGAGISFVISGIISVSFLGLIGAFPWSTLLDEYLPYYCLMGFGESFLTCGLITLFIVYCPQWVYSFRDQRYLIGK